MALWEICHSPSFEVGPWKIFISRVLNNNANPFLYSNWDTLHLNINVQNGGEVPRGRGERGERGQSLNNICNLIVLKVIFIRNANQEQDVLLGPKRSSPVKTLKTKQETYGHLMRRICQWANKWEEGMLGTLPNRDTQNTALSLWYDYVVLRLCDTPARPHCQTQFHRRHLPGNDSSAPLTSYAGLQ